MNRARRRTPVHSLVIRVIAGAVGLLAGTLPAGSSAQAYPAKTVRVIVGNAPGSLNDTAARLVFSKVGEALGQQFVVDNRPGAGGSIGAETAAKAPADGYTVLNAVNTMMVVNPFLYSKLGYDPMRDFEPVTMLVKVSEVLVVHPSLGTRTVKDFVGLAKARPQQVTYASGGNGHPTHLMMELFQRKAGIALVHVPYKGTSPGEWVLPHKLALDAQENMYIIDREGHRLQVYDKNLNYLREIKVEGWNPWDIGISRKGDDGFAFIADHALERMHKLSLKDGKVVATWGKQGLGPGEFDWVHGVVVDSRGAVYAADTYGQRLQKFVPGGSTSR